MLYDVVPRVPGKWLFFGGRLGVRLLIDAVAELHLKLVADGPERAGLEAHGYARSFGDSVRFTGYLGESGVAAELKEADVFVLLSSPKGCLWVLAARLFEGSLAGEMAEGLRHGKECS